MQYFLRELIFIRRLFILNFIFKIKILVQLFHILLQNVFKKHKI
jgi:hypothetical protein